MRVPRLRLSIEWADADREAGNEAQPRSVPSKCRWDYPRFQMYGVPPTTVLHPESLDRFAKAAESCQRRWTPFNTKCFVSVRWADGGRADSPLLESWPSRTLSLAEGQADRVVGDLLVMLLLVDLVHPHPSSSVLIPSFFFAAPPVKFDSQMHTGVHTTDQTPRSTFSFDASWEACEERHPVGCWGKALLCLHCRPRAGG